MKTIHAVYEKGVFRPTERVDLPEHSEVSVKPRQKKKKSKSQPTKKAMEAIYEIMSRRFRSGRSDVAARHNEHQP